MFEHLRHLQEHGIPVYHPSAPPHVPQIDDDDVEAEDVDMRGIEGELQHLLQEENTHPVYDIRPRDEQGRPVETVESSLA